MATSKTLQEKILASYAGAFEKFLALRALDWIFCPNLSRNPTILSAAMQDEWHILVHSRHEKAASATVEEKARLALEAQGIPSESLRSASAFTILGRLSRSEKQNLFHQTFVWLNSLTSKSFHSDVSRCGIVAPKSITNQ